MSKNEGSMDLDAYCGLDTGMLVMNLIWKIALKNVNSLILGYP
jgi:hypothetical protein